MTSRSWELSGVVFTVPVSMLAAGALAVSVPIIPARYPAPPFPGATYAWTQPGSTPHAVPHAQPPAWVPISTVQPAPPSTNYIWVQPGTAPHLTPFAELPSWVQVS
jgi:hypothetical protein